MTSKADILLWLNTRDAAEARTRILLVGAASSGFFGTYIAIFSLAIWSYSLESSSSNQTHIRWVAAITAVLITFNQVINLAGLRDICTWMVTFQYNPSTDEAPVIQCGNLENLVNRHSTNTISSLANIFVPPLVALLSDGVLAWRVYVIWHQPAWLRYMLGTSLGLNCVLGFVVAIERAHLVANRIVFYDGFGSHLGLLYTVWVWIALVLNSTMSISILVRIRLLRDIRQQGLGRYATVMRALIESAALSWVATLSSAIIWSFGQQRFKAATEVTPLRPPNEIDPSDPLPFTTFDFFSSVMFIALPYIMGISQVLIISRVNISKFENTQHLVRIITNPPTDETLSNDIPLKLIRNC